MLWYREDPCKESQYMISIVELLFPLRHVKFYFIISFANILILSVHAIFFVNLLPKFSNKV